MTLSEALAVKARGLTKEQLIALLRTVAENNLRADIRTIERAKIRIFRCSLTLSCALSAQSALSEMAVRPVRPSCGCSRSTSSIDLR
jgi:hypothetical protein